MIVVRCVRDCGSGESVASCRLQFAGAVIDVLCEWLNVVLRQIPTPVTTTRDHGRSL